MRMTGLEPANFNPRSRVGNDKLLHVSFRQHQEFQSTFPRGERPALPSMWSTARDFNPRSRVGNDPAIQSRGQYCIISIHVPAWGTTDCDTDSRRINTNFNPRSRVGNDAVLFPQQLIYLISIHVPAWGTTMIATHTRPATPFQSTFPRGERLQISTIFHLYICISSTNSHFSITSFCIFYLIHFFLICFFQLFMVRIFWGFSVYFWFALYRNNT